jgi:hypothetical protein
MLLVPVPRLDGLPKDSVKTIYNAMRECSLGQRLMVTLYFMSDLPDSRHRLRDIEDSLRRIFPPSIGGGLLPDSYVDFQATAVRTPLSMETREVRRGGLAEEDRLWTSPMRGYWRNTDLGNRFALQVLRDRGLLIQRGDTVLNPSEQSFPDVRRPYLEEEPAEVFTADADDLVPAEEPEQSLLAWVDPVLEGLPAVEHVKPGGGAMAVQVSGNLKDIRQVMQKLADTCSPISLELALRITKDGELIVRVSADG